MKTKIFLTVLAVTIGSSFATAQLLTGKSTSEKVNGAEKVLLSEKTGFPEYVLLKKETQFPVSRAMTWIRKTFAYSEQTGMLTLNTQTDETGAIHVRCQLTQGGIPVHDGVFILHCRDGNVYSVNGKFIPEIKTLSAARVTTTDAYETAKAAFPAKNYREGKWGEKNYGLSSASLVYIRSTASPLSAYRLTYRFDLYSQKPLQHQFVFIDAENGSWVRSLNQIHTHDKQGTAVTKYSGTQTIYVDSVSPTNYRLRDYTRGNGVVTFNLANDTDTLSYLDFTDTDNYWNNFNAQQDEVGTDAHWAAEMTYDYFKIIHSRNSIDGAGFKLKSFVHYDNSFFNAFWDGEAMYYGDGDGSPSTPLTTVDICGHEITHGLTTFTSNFDYVSESGALSEGYSDVFGTCIEFYAKPGDANWTVGEDCGVIIRDVANPNAYNNPDSYGGDFWDPWEEVHCNSTVFSHWFYLATLGGAGSNEFGDVYNITGITRAKTERIAFRAETVYLTNTSDYQDARFYTIMSAIDLYGGCSAEVRAVTDAWYAVHVGPAYVDAVVSDFDAVDTAFCSAPALVSFENMSVNGTTFQWNFGDGGTSTQLNPSHTYAAVGNYTVTLIADGGTCGKDTLILTDFITINPALPCNINMPITGTGALQTACSGTLYDSGGPNSNYQDNTNSFITIAPIGATSLTLQFVSFEFEQDWDTLFIYNGPNTSSPLIGAYTGYSLPNGGTVNAGPVVTIRQFTDTYVTYSGFEMHWTCTVGVDELSGDDNFDVYPNPAGEKLFIRCPEGKPIQILDAAGNVVWFEVSQSEILTLSLNSFRAGMYFVRIGGTDKVKRISVIR